MKALLSDKMKKIYTYRHSINIYECVATNSPILLSHTWPSELIIYTIRFKKLQKDVSSKPRLRHSQYTSSFDINQSKHFKNASEKKNKQKKKKQKQKKNWNDIYV